VRRSKEAPPVPKGRRVTVTGDSGGGAKKEGKELASAGKGLLKAAVGGDDKRRLKVQSSPPSWCDGKGLGPLASLESFDIAARPFESVL
jgi:hypothetical protein